jgi:putative redox protein
MSQQVSVTLREGMYFEADAGDGVTISLDAAEDVGGQGRGARPLKMMLVSLGGCMGMDVISILRKKRQDVTGLEVRVRGDRRTDEHPHLYTHIYVTFVVSGHDVDPRAVERAIELSYTRYCPAVGLLKQAVPIDTDYQIVEA